MTFQYKPRGYVHFDAPVTREVAERLATDPMAVSRHSFYPFIEHIVTTQKIRKAQGGGVVMRPPKHRPIACAAHKDAHIYSHYSRVLQRLYEAELRRRSLGHVVTAFRAIEGRCNIDFADEVFNFIGACSGCYALASDVSDFFNQINHVLLKLTLQRLLGVERLPADHFAVFKNITSYCKVDRDELFRALGMDPLLPRADRRHRICTPRQFREIVIEGGLCRQNMEGKGVPQGSPISALLANLYMLEFDTTINAFVSQHGGMYRRYCDDVLVVLPTLELRREASVLIQHHLTSLGLVAHPEKTELIDFPNSGERAVIPKPLNYLGFTFDGVHKRIRPASIARYYKKMRRGVNRAKAVRSRASRGVAYWNWTPLRTRKINILYSYIGRHNFPAYVFKAARVMNDPGIKKQIKSHWSELKALIAE